MLTQKSLLVTCYCFDSHQGAAVLGVLLRRGVKILLMLDGNQLRNASCANQAQNVLSLMQSATDQGGSLEIKGYTPTGSFCSCLHVKSWCLDETLYIGGSYNWTMNAEKNNQEHLITAKDSGSCDHYLRWFNSLWTDARAFYVKRELLVGAVAKAKERSRSRASKRD